MKRRPSVVAVAVYFTLVGLLLIWAVWLLTTADPDGGRRPVGGVMLVAGVVLGVFGAASAYRSRRG